MWGITMNTNTNPKTDISESRLDASELSGILTPDLAALSKMAAELFPEFYESSITENSDQIAGHPPVLPEAVSELRTDYPGIQNGDNSFAFLEEARPIFLEIGNPLESGGGYASPAISVNPILVPNLERSTGLFDVAAIRRDFPILTEKVNGRDLIWFDNAATTQKPKAVIDRVRYFYEHENSNVHRGAHTLAARSTDAYEAAREKVARLLNASSTKEIIYVRGTTEGINLVAHSWGRQNISKGDEIVLSHLEHHANIVPWQMIASELGAKLRIIPVDESGQLILSEFAKILNARTKLVSVTQVSNALGTITPISQIVEMAHQYDAKVLVDGAQSISHMKVDVRDLDLDFFVFSGHKIYAPTGIGVVYGKESLLDSMVPYQGGGNMIADVTFERTIYQSAPAKFEAGTGNIADATGLGAAIDYVNQIGIENIARYEQELLEYGTDRLGKIPGLRFIGTAKEKASVLSFVLNGFTTEEVGKALGAEGIAVRAGHHCAQPILRRFGIESTVRPSFAFYNTRDEVDKLGDVIRHITKSRG
jgi:cysteine desulfurase / selenocysteine lyase